MVLFRSRRFCTGLVGLLLTGAVAACGGDDDDASVDPSAGAAGRAGQASSGSSGQTAAGAGGSGGQAASGGSGHATGGASGGGQAASGSSGHAGSAGVGQAGGPGGAGGAGGGGASTGGGAGKGGGAGTEGGAGTDGDAGDGGTDGGAGSEAGAGQGAGGAAGKSGGAGGAAGKSGGSGGGGKSGSAGGAGKGGAGGSVGECAPLFGGAMLGATIDGSQKIASASIDKFKALGVKSVRVYVSINQWSKTSGTDMPVNDSAVAAVKTVHAAGIHVVMALVGEGGSEPASAQATRDVVKVLVETKGLKDVVDIWELGNEPDIAISSGSPVGKYWKSKNIDTYATKYLLPAAKLLHTYTKGGKALQVANAPPSSSPDLVKQMLDTKDPEDTSTACSKDPSKCATARSYVDYVNLHFYRTELTNPDPGNKYPQDLKTFLAKLNEIAAGKPTMSTEWSMNDPGKGTQAWADLIAHAWEDDCLIRDSLAIAHYYTWTADLTQKHGADGVYLVDKSTNPVTLTPNEPFHTMFAGLE